MIVFSQQKKDYTCGPSCIVNVGKLLNMTFDEIAISILLNSQPKKGTSNELLAKFASIFLPVESYGENTYQNGLAIWNIQNAISGNGHFVVVLGIENDFVRYYDPYWNLVLNILKKDIIFKSGDLKYNNWSINFKTNKNFYFEPYQTIKEFHPLGQNSSVELWLAKNSINPESQL